MIGAVLGSLTCLLQVAANSESTKALELPLPIKHGQTDISTTIWSAKSSSGQSRTTPLKVCRAAMAAAI